ncbi:MULTISPECIES: hypothetical protein [Luteimonas]|uniref:hypothetical protein n=1 Tax=Luteimonas TaxID=83614 RepID=UPI000C79EAAF|nr:MULTISPECIES: hypothetical protein [Luteimonas]
MNASKEPFLMFIARTPGAVISELLRVATAAGLVSRLGDRLFDPSNSHQSLSDRHDDTHAELMRMIQVGDGLQAHAFDFSLDRIASGGRDRVDWRFESSAGKTPEFLALLVAMRAAFANVDGIEDQVRHAPHVTFAYGAPAAIPTVRFPAVSWHLARIELVRRMRDPYRYDTLAGWDLLPPTHRGAAQPPLF